MRWAVSARPVHYQVVSFPRSLALNPSLPFTSSDYSSQCVTYMYDLVSTTVSWLQCGRVREAVSIRASARDAPNEPAASYFPITLPYTAPSTPPSSASAGASKTATSTGPSSSPSSTDAPQNSGKYSVILALFMKLTSFIHRGHWLDCRLRNRWYRSDRHASNRRDLRLPTHQTPTEKGRLQAGRGHQSFTRGTPGRRRGRAAGTAAIQLHARTAVLLWR